LKVGIRHGIGSVFYLRYRSERHFCQVYKCHIIARKRLESALGKIDRKEGLTEFEFKVLEFLGNHFIWRPAFTSNQLFTEFKCVLTLERIIGKADGKTLNHAKTFLTLYALALMHGSAIVLDDGQRARLLGGFANRERRLEVKVEIVFNELAKPIMTPVCLFLTDLQPEEHCDPGDAGQFRRNESLGGSD
jgi:hypothetical protein